MTVFVDDMYLRPMGQFRCMKMSHMIASTDDELHALADRIGLRRRWFQGDHYDVSMSLRARAIAAGAYPVTMHQLGVVRIIQRRTGRMPDDAIIAEQLWKIHIWSRKSV